jgi:hypothetical protein
VTLVVARAGSAKLSCGETYVPARRVVVLVGVMHAAGYSRAPQPWPLILAGGSTSTGPWPPSSNRCPDGAYVTTGATCSWRTVLGQP